MVIEAKGTLSLDGKNFINKIKEAGDSVEKNLDSKLGSLKKNIVQAFSVTAIANFAQKIMSAADEVDNMSKRLGVSAETFQSLRVVAQDSGLSVNDFEAAILKLTASAADAEAGNKAMADAFDKLGISVGDLEQMNPEQLFEALAKEISANSDNADTLSAAFDVIGMRAGPRLLSVMEDLGEKGFEKLNKEMLDGNKIMSEDTIKNWDNLEQKIVDATRVLQSFVGEWGGKFVGLLEDFGEAVGVAFSGASFEDYHRVQNEMEAFARRQKEIQDERKAEQEAIEKAKKRERELDEDILELEGEIKEQLKGRKTEAEELEDQQKKVKDLEEKIKGLNVDIKEEYKERLGLTKALLTEQELLEAMEKKRRDAEEKAQKDLEEWQPKYYDEKEEYLDRVYQKTLDQMDLEDRIEVLNKKLLTAKKDQQEAAEKFGEQSEENYQALNRVLDIEEDIEELEGKRKESSEKIKQSSVEQLEAVEKLQGIFKVMTEEELDGFVEKLKEIAQELGNLPDVDLGWVESLSNLDLSGLNETRGKNVRDFLKAVAEAADELAAVPPDALKFLESLSELEIKGLNETRGRNVGDFLKAIAEGVQGVDLTALEGIVTLLSALDEIEALGTDTNVNISLPADFEGIPLVFDDDTDATMKSIESSLKTLAGLKGVVWA